MTGQSVPWLIWRTCVTDQIGRQRAVANLLCRCELGCTPSLPTLLLASPHFLAKRCFCCRALQRAC